MDTKDKKPVRRSANRRPDSRRPAAARSAAAKSGTARRDAAPERRRRPSSAQARKPMPQQKKRVVRPPREDIPEVVYTIPKPFRKGQFVLKLVSVVAVVMAMVLALSIFFRVDTIQVYGTDKYTPWMIREASGVEEGDSLLGVSKARVAGRIIAKLPYVDKVKVGINLPGTVNIEITELKVTYAVQASDSTWWLITSDGRVVDQIDTTAANGYTKILGVQIESPAEGQTVQAAPLQQPEDSDEDTEETQPVEETTEATEATEETESTEETEATEETTADASEETAEPTKATSETVPSSPVELPVQADLTHDQVLNVALEITQCLERSEVIGQIASIDVSDPANLTMEYGQRFHVLLGDAQRLEYKISYMAQAVRQLHDDIAGEMDVSFAFSEEAILTPLK